MLHGIAYYINAAGPAYCERQGGLRFYQVHESLVYRPQADCVCRFWVDLFRFLSHLITVKDSHTYGPKKLAASEILQAHLECSENRSNLKVIHLDPHRPNEFKRRFPFHEAVSILLLPLVTACGTDAVRVVPSKHTHLMPSPLVV